jgi:hypothetical protein
MAGQTMATQAVAPGTATPSSPAAAGLTAEGAAGAAVPAAGERARPQLELVHPAQRAEAPAPEVRGGVAPAEAVLPAPAGELPGVSKGVGEIRPAAPAVTREAVEQRPSTGAAERAAAQQAMQTSGLPATGQPPGIASAPTKPPPAAPVPLPPPPGVTPEPGSRRRRRRPEGEAPPEGERRPSETPAPGGERPPEGRRLPERPGAVPVPLEKGGPAKPEQAALAEVAGEKAAAPLEAATPAVRAGGEATGPAGGGGGVPAAGGGAEPATEGGSEDTAAQDEVEARMTAANPQAAEEEAEAEAEASPEEAQAEAPEPAPAAESTPPETTGEAGISRETVASAAAAEEAEGEGVAPAAEAEQTTVAEAQRETDPEALQRIEDAGAARAEQADTQRSAEAIAEEHAEERVEQQAETGETAAGGGEAGLTPAERDAGMSALAESAGGGGGAEAAAGGGGGGGGGEAVPEPEAAPDTAGIDPASGLGAAASLQPVQAAQALDGVSASVDRTTQEEAAALQAQIPQVEVGGDGGESALQTLPRAPAPRRPAQAEPGVARPTPEPEPLPEAPPAPTAALPTPSVRSTEEGTVSREDAARVAGSIRDIPTEDPGLDVPAGAPPKLELAGDADPTQMGDQQAELDRTIAEQRVQGAADVAAPAGEDRVRVTRPREVLRVGTVTPPGAAGGGGVGEAAATEKEIGIIAEEQQGDEVRAAVAKAQGDMAAKRVEHRRAVVEEKAKTEQDLANLREENVAQQQAAKADVRADVAQARADWSEAQRAEVGSANEKALREIAQGNEKIRKEETQANEEAARHIDEGEQRAAEEKEKAEREAAQKKREAEAQAEAEDDGIFGWIASKVSSFFDALKEGITAIFDAAKKLVRAAIEAAKKLAVAVIEKARQAIVGLIRAVGAALIAIGDVLLAAFPALREKWRGYIERRVKAAEDTVNAIADRLKKGVTKLLDALGKAFDFLLDAFKKGMLAVLDAAKAVVVGAINIAKKVAQAIGTFLQLVADVASGPIRWLSNLGSAVVDGIKNHLWKAFQAAVKEWFNSKLEELLGIGTAIWNVLKQGGITLKEVGQMAFDALKAAIPRALIELLIEKLVAMLVPAAGAVMAVIEGLQAAWGAIKRIIAALGKFVAFLKAVKGGGAGPQFAEMLAAAAIVVIDFVANWLVRKLRGPASKVGSKVKAIAQKILAKIKAGAKKVGKALKKAGSRVRGAFKKGRKKFSDWRARRKARKEAKKGKADAAKKKQDKEAAKRKKLERAVNALRPKVKALLGKGISRLALRLKLGWWRTTHRLSKLQLQGARIIAAVNPEDTLTEAEELELGSVLEPIIQKAEADFLEQLAKAQAGGAPGEAAAATPFEKRVATMREIHEVMEQPEQLTWKLRQLGRAKALVAWMRAQAGGAMQFLRFFKRAQQRYWDVNLNTVIVQMGGGGGTYEDIAKKEPTLGFSGKTETLLALEGARSPGMTTTFAVSQATALAETAAGVKSGEQAVQEVLVERNPMAPQKSSVAATAEFGDAAVLEGRGPKELATIEAAGAERKRRIVRVFQHLRQVLKSKRDILGEKSALAKVAEAFDRWFRANRPGASASADEVEAAADNLTKKLVLFLKSFTG